MALRFLDDSGYSSGMHRDMPSWMIPNGGVFDQLNMLNDQPGIARQRMGSTALVSGAQTAFGTSLGFCYSADGTPIEELYALNGKTGDVYSINKTNGASTNLGGLGEAGIDGRAVRHFGFLVFPQANTANTFRRAVYVAGQTNTTTFANTVAAQIAAGNSQITLTGADVTTNVKVGAIVSVSNATNIYFGRVVSIDTTKLFTVWPTPTFTDAAIAAANCSTQPVYGVGAGFSGGGCAASFQNRLLLGNTNDMNSTARSLITDRQIIYSVLPTETQTLATVIHSGATFLYTVGWPKLNYISVPGADPIVAMEPISDGELLILTPRDLVIFRGNLTTQLATTSPTITYDIYPLGTTLGCLSDLSVHRTPVGIMWAGNEGVFAYWPPIRRNPAKTGVRNLMDNKILDYWQTLVNPSSGSFVIHGAAYVRGHYIISGTSNGVTFSLACNLSNDAWTRLSGAGTDIFVSVARPSIPQQVYAARWWDQTGAAPSMTNGQTLRLEAMMNPYVAGATTTDADASAIATSLTTRTVTGDADTQKVFHRVTARTQISSTTAGVTLTAQSTIDAADTDASRTRALGSLSNTATLTLSNATNAQPIVCTTTTNHGLQSDDFVEIDAVLGNLNANGRNRIKVTGATTFELTGIPGSAAYTSGGKVKKITEQDYLASSVNEGQGMSLTIASAGVNNLEVHGFRIACEEREQVMSA